MRIPILSPSHLFLGATCEHRYEAARVPMRHHRIVQFALCSALATSCATHQRPPLPLPTHPLTLTPDAPFRALPPPPEAPHAWHFPEPEVLYLKNGFTILLVRSEDENEVALDFATRAAAETGNPHTAGIASLAGLLLADADNSARPASIAVERGLQFRPRISRDGGDFLLTANPADLDSALQRILTTLAHPTCRAQTLERLREQDANFLIRRASSPEQSGVDLVRRRLYGEEHPLGLPQEGTRAVIDGATIDDVRGYCTDRIQPQNSALVVVASSSMKDKLPLIERELGDWATGEPTVSPPPPGPANVTGNPVELLPWFGDEQSWLVLGVSGPSRTAPEYPAFLMIANLLGDHFNPKAHRPTESRAEKTAAQAWVDSSGLGTTLFVTMPVVPGDEGKTAQAVQHELEALAAKPVPAEDLAVAQSRFASSVGDAYASPADTAVTIGALFDARLPYNTEAALVTRVQALTPDEVQHAAQSTLHPDRSRIIVVGDPNRAVPSLRAAGFKPPQSAPASPAE